MIAQEATEKLGRKVELDVMRPLQAFDTAGRARALAAVVQTLALAKETGVDTDKALSLRFLRGAVQGQHAGESRAGPPLACTLHFQQFHLFSVKFFPSNQASIKQVSQLLQFIRNTELGVAFRRRSYCNKLRINRDFATITRISVIAWNIAENGRDESNDQSTYYPPL